jgi:hypothetical protein
MGTHALTARRNGAATRSVRSKMIVPENDATLPDGWQTLVLRQK